MESDPQAPTQEFLPIPTPQSSQSPITLQAWVDRGSSGGAISPSSSKNNPAVITLHYWGGSASTYHHIPPLLHKHSSTTAAAATTTTTTVISLSHRGWGLSSRADPDAVSAYTIAALASDVIAVLPVLVARGLVSSTFGFVICGHSMGAKVAMAVASRCLTGQVVGGSGQLELPPLRGLLLLAPAPPGPLVLPEEMRQQQGAAYDTPDSVKWTAREVLTAAKGAGLRGGDADMDMIVRDSLAGSKAARKAWPEIGMAEDVDVSPLRGRNGVKVRVLVARGDRVETAERVERDTVGSLRRGGVEEVVLRVVETEELECGHLLPLEAPGVVVEELVELLREVRGG